MLVLLDLLGAPDPQFYSFFKETDTSYTHLVDIEARLVKANLLEKYTPTTLSKNDDSSQSYFRALSHRSLYAEDDHIPFLQRGVPILHLIAAPFPKVWHTVNDNRSAIDMASVNNINKMLRIFLIEYLQLKV